MRITQRFAGALLLSAATVTIAQAPTAPRSPDDAEMGRSGSASRPARVDPAVLARFDADYQASQGVARPVFERYLPTLGSAAILDYLENRYAICHWQAHDLGRALLTLRKDVGTALRECGTRCTSACMHGVVGEAFGATSPASIAASMDSFCATGAMAAIHKPGNCAHGIGHALMFASGDELEKSLNGCLYFREPAMRYYCATGVFMEFMPKRKKTPPTSLHEPCSLYPDFAAACYRYRAPMMLAELNGDRDAFQRECQSLQGSARLGCFHGLGATLTEPLLGGPGLLRRVCGTGLAAERVMCIEGAIERVAEYDEAAATAACATLEPTDRAVCLAAAKGKMYRTDKPSLPLYHDPSLVTKRKPLADPASREGRKP